MGARQSKRSVDITTTPKKEGEAAVEGEGNIEKIGDLDVKVTNGDVHKEIEHAEKIKDESEKGDIKENGLPESEEEAKTPEKDVIPQVTGDQLNDTTSSEKPEKSNNESEEKIEETPEAKKSKEKKKKKWSFRSISFTKKDKSKPVKEAAEKNGDVKEVAEENPEENAVTSPSGETPKTETQKEEAPAAQAAEPSAVANGDATTEELNKTPSTESEKSKKEEQEPKQATATTVTTAEEPKAPEPAKETPSVESVPSPVAVVKEEEIAPVVPPQEEPPVAVAEPVVEERKEVAPEITESNEVRQECGDTTTGDSVAAPATAAVVEE